MVSLGIRPLEIWALGLLVVIVGLVAILFAVNAYVTNRAQKLRAKKRDEARAINSRINTIKAEYQNVINRLRSEVKKLQPLPVMKQECPHCGANSRAEIRHQEKTEIVENGWYWLFVTYLLMCLACAKTYRYNGKRKRGEGVKVRVARLKKEAAERKERERLAAIARAERRRRDEAYRRRQQSQRSSSSAWSGSRGGFSGGSFGGGGSGGGGAGGGIR